MVEFSNSVLLRKGYTPVFMPVFVKARAKFKLILEYACDADTELHANVYMIDETGDFNHTVIPLKHHGGKNYKEVSLTVAAGAVIGEKSAHIRLWSIDTNPVRIKNVRITILDEGELYKDEEYTVPFRYNIGIIKFHNLLHAEILSRQLGLNPVDYRIDKMKNFDFLIFLGPMLTTADKKLQLLFQFKALYPKTKIILWWVGSDVLNAINNKNFDCKLINSLAYKNICVSSELQKELKSIGVNADILTLIPNVDKYVLTKLPKIYTVGIYMPSSRLWFFKYKELVEIIEKTPNIKYIIYGNKKELKFPKNAVVMGWVNNTHEILKKCNCILRLTQHDGYPQTIIESILMGRCVITNHNFPGVVFAEDFTVEKIVNLIKKKPKLDNKYVDYYKENFNNSILYNDLKRVVESIEIEIPHKFGKNNGIATHIETLSKYSRNNILKNYGGVSLINTQACGINTDKIDVYTAHSYYTMEDYGRTAPNVGVIRNAKTADRIICVSNYVRDFLVSSGINKNKITVIYNPLDLDEIDNVKPMKDLPKNFSLFIGNKKVKRVNLLIELAKKYPRDKFVAIACKHETPSNVTNITSATRDETLSIMRACGTYLCLSKRESCPYALLESMAMKKKCIISNFAGQKEIITDGINGFTFIPDNIKSLCNAYDNAKKSRHYKIRAEARLTIDRRFDARIQAPKYDSVYVPPKISVITFVHCSKDNKRLELLKDCIESVRNQNYPSYEHIIVDDGSEILLYKDIIKMRDSHLKYYWKPHTGITNTTDTFNYGLKVAQGKYIIYLASDDKEMGSTLKTLSEYLYSNKGTIGVVGNYVEEKIRNGKVISRRTIIKKEPSIKDRLLKSNCICGCAMMFRKSALQKIQLPPDNTGFCSDYDLWVRLSEVGKIDRIDYVAVRYRRHPDATMFKTVKNMEYRNKCIRNVIESAKERRGIE